MVSQLRTPTAARAGRGRGCGRSSLIFPSAASSAAFSSRHWPGVRSPSETGPTAMRTSRKVGWPTARRHSADLAIAPLADRQAQPGGRDVLAEPDRHGSIGQRGRFGQQFDLGRASPAVIQDDTSAQRLECRRIGGPLDLDQIGLGMLEPRVGEAMRQSSIVGQEQQAFAVTIEPAGRIDPLDRDEFFERESVAGVAELAQDVVGLEEGDGAGRQVQSPGRPVSGFRSKRINRSTKHAILRPVGLPDQQPGGSIMKRIIALGIVFAAFAGRERHGAARISYDASGPTFSNPDFGGAATVRRLQSPAAEIVIVATHVGRKSDCTHCTRLVYQCILRK